MKRFYEHINGCTSNMYEDENGEWVDAEEALDAIAKAEAERDEKRRDNGRILLEKDELANASAERIRALEAELGDARLTILALKDQAIAWKAAGLPAGEVLRRTIWGHRKGPFDDSDPEP